VTVEELARLVKRMREAQARYFRTRDTAALAESKDLERRIDEAVRGVLSPEPPGLFGKEG
jgi:hypothetical protein